MVTDGDGNSGNREMFLINAVSCYDQQVCARSTSCWTSELRPHHDSRLAKSSDSSRFIAFRVISLLDNNPKRLRAYEEIKIKSCFCA